MAHDDECVDDFHRVHHIDEMARRGCELPMRRGLDAGRGFGAYAEEFVEET